MKDTHALTASTTDPLREDLSALIQDMEDWQRRLREHSEHALAAIDGFEESCPDSNLTHPLYAAYSNLIAHFEATDAMGHTCLDQLGMLRQNLHGASARIGQRRLVQAARGTKKIISDELEHMKTILPLLGGTLNTLEKLEGYDAQSERAIDAYEAMLTAQTTQFLKLHAEHLAIAEELTRLAAGIVPLALPVADTMTLEQRRDFLLGIMDEIAAVQTPTVEFIKLYEEMLAFLPPTGDHVEGREELAALLPRIRAGFEDPNITGKNEAESYAHLRRVIAMRPHDNALELGACAPLVLGRLHARVGDLHALQTAIDAFAAGLDQALQSAETREALGESCIRGLEAHRATLAEAYGPFQSHVATYEQLLQRCQQQINPPGHGRA